MSGNMSSQRPFFLSTFFAAFRQQTTPSSLSNASASTQQPNKHNPQPTAAQPASAATPRSITTSAAAVAASQATSPSTSASRSGGVMSQLPLHSPRHPHHHHHHHSGGIPIPQSQGTHDNSHGRRRGSDSSSEGFRDALGTEKLYIGGRTATGEERFFKLGVVRRVRSGDRLSLDRLSL
ncbi:uncharacterized protein B0T15DRAFT_165855 [Chaetomium strumarium]|uniref:Uncharacterized protein n=1 Tax=Chaetomium strumarium TaxID=1170767 RepID=A0AAJ0M394_9PEZI|nr:hypothetical protein B0T15DRAFT_165855 [Chaetomium strumarium]